MKLGFLHIPRTGGTYLESLLQSLGPKKFINFFGTPDNQKANGIGIIERIEEDKTMQARMASNPNWKTCNVFSGHFSANIEPYINGEVKFFTILRDPLQRTISFVKKVTSSRGFAEQLKQGSGKIGDAVFWKNFESYILSKNKQGLMTHERHGFSNYMTKAIAGLNLSSETIEVNNAILDKAKKNLDDMFYVGTFDSYEDTLRDVLSIFNINHLISIRPKTVSVVPDSTLELLTKLNEFDIELYNYFINKK